MCPVGHISDYSPHFVLTLTPKLSQPHTTCTSKFPQNHNSRAELCSRKNDNISVISFIIMTSTQEKNIWKKKDLFSLAFSISLVLRCKHHGSRSLSWRKLISRYSESRHSGRAQGNKQRQTSYILQLSSSPKIPVNELSRNKNNHNKDHDFWENNVCWCLSRLFKFIFIIKM